jgi:uncharacterized protein Yka (UPF0111/DUF47 family)
LIRRDIKRFLIVGEKGVFREISEIIGLAKKANTIITKIVMDDYMVKPFKDEVEAVSSIEKESDDIAFRLSEEITGGAISPNIIDELLESVQHADNIVDHYHNLSRELGRMSCAELAGCQIDHEWNTLFASLLSLAESALSRLEKLLSTSDMAEILEMRKEIEDLEEKGDSIKDTAFDNLYAAAPKLNYLQFFHYSEVLHLCDDILDESEDLSDSLVSVVTSILK